MKILEFRRNITDYLVERYYIEKLDSKTMVIFEVLFDEELDRIDEFTEETISKIMETICDKLNIRYEEYTVVSDYTIIF